MSVLLNLHCVGGQLSLVGEWRRSTAMHARRQVAQVACSGLKVTFARRSVSIEPVQALVLRARRFSRKRFGSQRRLGNVNSMSPSCSTTQGKLRVRCSVLPFCIDVFLLEYTLATTSYRKRQARRGTVIPCSIASMRQRLTMSFTPTRLARIL